LTGHDRKTQEDHVVTQGLGNRPVVLVLDLKYRLLADHPRQGWLRVLRRRADANGPRGWQALAELARLLPEARERGVPVIYSAEFGQGSRWPGSARWPKKAPRHGQVVESATRDAIVSEVAPQHNDLVLTKPVERSSFSVPLVELLADLQADTLLVTGLGTKEAIDATVMEGFSLNYRVAVVPECTCDRDDAAHAQTLLQIHHNYAAVHPMHEITSYLRSLPRDLFDAQLSDIRKAQAACQLARLKAVASL
jgi:nicotinamidase-related amidase